MFTSKFTLKCKIIDELSERGGRCYRVYNKLVRWHWLIGSDALNEACVFHLCKMVEVAMNESIVQYVRMRLGVKMPDFFMKYDDTVGFEIKIKTTKRLEVNLNRYYFTIAKERRLKAVSIGDVGEMLHTLKYRGHLCDDNDSIWIMDDDLHSVLRTLGKLRGEATHGTDATTDDLLESMREKTQWLLDIYGQRMLLMKRLCMNADAN